MEFREPTELIEFLEPYPGQVVDLALQARLVLLEMYWPVSEIYYDANSAVCSGFTYTGRVSDNFVNLAVYADHVTLIFQKGVHLNDPHGLLKGGGNQVRHIRLAGIETLRQAAVIELLSLAAIQAPGSRGGTEPTVIIKVMKGRKRRPTRDIDRGM